MELRTIRQLPETAVAQGDDAIAIQADGGPVQQIPLSRVIGRLGPVDLVVAEVADLALDQDAGVLAIVYADPDETANGYYVKVGASGGGSWEHSLVFRGAPGMTAYEVAVANGFAGTEEEWLDTLVGPPGGVPNGGAARQVLAKASGADQDNTWVSLARNASFQVIATPTASEMLLLWTPAAGETVVFADEFAGSSGIAVGHPGATYTMPVKVDGVAVGTIAISAAGAVSFTTTGGTVTVVGGVNYLSVQGAAAPDGAFQNATFTLKGTLA